MDAEYNDYDYRDHEYNEDEPEHDQKWVDGPNLEALSSLARDELERFYQKAEALIKKCNDAIWMDPIESMRMVTNEYGDVRVVSSQLRVSKEQLECNPEQPRRERFSVKVWQMAGDSIMAEGADCALQSLREAVEEFFGQSFVDKE